MRLDFRLSMPGRGNAVYSHFGEGRVYSLVRRVSETRGRELLREGSWTHRWDDGWVARVTATELRGRAPRSDGFAGYDWMVDNIIAHGSTEK